MLRIHGSARSRAVRTLWMVGELGLDYAHEDILPRSDPTRTPAFRKLDPNGRVPVIEDDGFVLRESMAINLYLAKKHASPMYPRSLEDEALVWQWCFWETDRLDRQIVNYVNHTSALPEADRKAAVADAAWAEIVPAFDVLEGALSGRQWLVGDDFSVADLNVAAALYRGLSMDLSRWPSLDAWLKRCWERPAAKRARAMRE
ncbi:MAG: glutathione S-transferase family protein [Gammaproteobacteria bacterium]|nr:glutathione S-transferase family protein [Gammaproteobacteria bacterium]